MDVLTQPGREGRDAPRVTVCIPTRNRRDLLLTCLENVLSQTLEGLEVFVLDNASTDDTIEAVRRLGDPRVTVLPLEQDIGMHGNMTRALHQGTAPYLTLVQDDDVLLPHHLQRMVAVLDERPDVGAVTSAFYFIDIHGRRTSGPTNWMQADRDVLEPGQLFRERTFGNALRMHVSTVILRRQLVATERFDVADAGHCDMALWLRLSLQTSFAYLHDPQAEIRHHADAENIKDGTCVFVDGVPRIRSFARLTVVHGVKERFLSQHGDLLSPEERHVLERSMRKYARHQIGQVLLQDALAHRNGRRLLAMLRQAARIEPTVAVSRWTVIPLLAAAIGPSTLTLAGRLRGRPLADPARV